MYLGKTYGQHNPLFGDDPDAFVSAVKGWVGANHSLRFDFKGLIVEENLVVAHSHLTQLGGPGHSGD